MNNKQIKLIIFDGYGVIFNGGYPPTCKLLAKKFQRNTQELYKIIYTKYFNLAATKKISQNQAWQKAINDLNLPLNVEEIKKIHYSFMNLNLPVINLIKKLQTEYKTVLLTKNTRSQLKDALEIMPQAKKIFGKNIINTWEYNLAKASKETIKMIAQKYQVKFKEIVYTDDQAENLKEAKSLGVNTILYTNLKDLKNSLYSLLK